MPTFYADPDQPGGPPDILNGDNELQMKALRDYVVSLGLPADAGKQQVATSGTGATATP